MMTNKEQFDLIEKLINEKKISQELREDMKRDLFKQRLLTVEQFENKYKIKI